MAKQFPTHKFLIALSNENAGGAIASFIHNNRQYLHFLVDNVRYAQPTKEHPEGWVTETPYLASLQSASFTEDQEWFLSLRNVDRIFGGFVENLAKYKEYGIKVFDLDEQLAQMMFNTRCSLTSEFGRLPYPLMFIKLPPLLQYDMLFYNPPDINDLQRKGIIKQDPATGNIVYLDSNNQRKTIGRLEDLVAMIEEHRTGGHVVKATWLVVRECLDKTNGSIMLSAHLVGDDFWKWRFGLSGSEQVAVSGLTVFVPKNVELDVVIKKYSHKLLQPEGAPKDRDDPESYMLERTLRTVLNVLFYLNAAGHRKKPFRKHLINKFGNVRHPSGLKCSEFFPTEVLFNQEIDLKLEQSPLSNGGSGSNKHVRAHWRRGHLRAQRFGSGLSQSKVLWIKPVLVNKDLLLVGQETNVGVYKVK